MYTITYLSVIRLRLRRNDFNLHEIHNDIQLAKEESNVQVKLQSVEKNLIQQYMTYIYT